MEAYRQGDHFIMDKIDEMICNEEMVSSFVEDRDSSQTRGVHFRDDVRPIPKRAENSLTVSSKKMRSLRCEPTLHLSLAVLRANV